MMFFARVIAGKPPEVFALTDVLLVTPRSWSFVSYRRGACAIGYTRDSALQAAMRRLDMPRTVRPALRVSVQRSAL